MNILTNLELNRNQILNGVFQKLASAPSNPSEGQYYFNTVSKLLQVYNGTKWVDAGATPGELPELIIDNIEGLRAALDDKVDDVQVRTDVPPNAKFTDTIATKESLGLGNVDNTADDYKPVSIATQTELDKKESIANVNTKIAGIELGANTYTDNKIEELVGGAPETLNTIYEIAAALGDDPNAISTILSQLGLKTEKYNIIIGDGIATEYIITHNLGTKNAVVQLRQSGFPHALVYTDVEMTTDNTLTLVFAEPPTEGEYVATVIG